MSSERSSHTSECFEEQYAKYRPYFVRIATSYVRDRMAAEDLVTDSFLSAWQSNNPASREHFAAFVTTVLHRKCLNWLRDRSTHLRAQQNLHQHEQRMLSEAIRSLESDTPHGVLLEDALTIIERELLRMPVRRRRIFLAHRYEDMSYREIAAIYNLSEGQVNYEMQMARETLRIALKDYLPLVALLFVDI